MQLAHALSERLTPACLRPSRSRARERAKVFYERPRRPVVVASFPRSGTHLTIDMLRRHFEMCDAWKWPGERNDNLYVDLDRLLSTHFDSGPRHERSPLGERQALRILQRTPRPVIKTHAFPGFGAHLRERPEWVAWLRRQADIIYVVRDGREVACSLQLMAADQSDEANVPVGAFLRQKQAWFLPGTARGRTMARLWADHVRGWRGVPGVHVLSFGELLENPTGTLSRLAEVVGESPRERRPLLPPHPESKLQGRLDRLFRMRPTSTALLTRSSRHARKKWHDALTEADRRFFRTETDALLEQLGFAPSPDWVRCEE